MIALGIAEQNKDIPNEVIEKDINDTENEIKDYEDEKEILMRNPQENKLRIYMLEGKISIRKGFVSKLKSILEIRKND